MMADPERKHPDPHTGRHPRHEGDEPIAQRGAHEPRSVGKQGHQDLQRGVEDTDLRGGGDYQRRTQNDHHANRNSRHQRSRRGGA